MVFITNSLGKKFKNLNAPLTPQWFDKPLFAKQK
jgi:hypothetical protein